MSLGMILAFVVAAGGSLAIGIALFRSVVGVEDALPITRGRRAAVKSSAEFSASTTATTVSLATVVIAYFELAPYLGPWLFWTVLTTAAGILLVRLVARRIWTRLAAYSPHIPSLHEFLGTEFSSHRVRLVAGLCTSLGFLGALAVELTVGSRFLASANPGIPYLLIVIVLSGVGVAYTALGGFRAVVLTDRLQMGAIWLFAAVLAIVYGLYFRSAPQEWGTAMSALTDLRPREGLGAFLVGIFIINVPTYLADMSIWQRLGGTEREEDVESGLSRSVVGVSVIWGLLCVLAVVAPAVSNREEGINPLVGILLGLANWLPSPVVILITFALGLGLLSAMLSTASTQLIAFTHAAHEDVLRQLRPGRKAAPLESPRLLILIAATLAVAAVELLNRLGLSVADLVFAGVGSQLGLVPAVLVGLLRPREELRRLGSRVMIGVSLGFVAGWACAIGGRLVESPNLTFLAPAASLAVSALVLSTGFLGRRST